MDDGSRDGEGRYGPEGGRGEVRGAVYKTEEVVVKTYKDKGPSKLGAHQNKATVVR